MTKLCDCGVAFMGSAVPLTIRDTEPHIGAPGQRSLLSGLLLCQTGQGKHADKGKFSLTVMVITILSIPGSKAVRTHCTLFKQVVITKNCQAPPQF